MLLKPGVGHRYFAVYKPFNMVSQFVSSHEVNLLGNLNFEFPVGTHAIGRLDNHSEGLLLLTTNKAITRLLFQDSIPHPRRYLVQVNNEVSSENIDRLRRGVMLSGIAGTRWTSSSCHVERVTAPDELCTLSNERNIFPPNSWLSITLTEGKFHQVRKMIRAVGHRCKRLVRISIGNLDLADMKPGDVKEMSEEDFFNKLNLKRTVTIV